jgi:Trk K+ transport system NAD-binding subunit
LLFSKIFPEPVKQKEGILLAGNHEILISLAKKLAYGEGTLIIADSSERILQRLDELHLAYIYWDKLQRSRLQELRSMTVHTFVAAYDNSPKNIEACELARGLNRQSYFNAI